MTKCPSQLIEEFFKGNQRKIRAWWVTPNALLGGWTPHHMIQSGMENKLEKFIRGQLRENGYPISANIRRRKKK